MVSVFYEYFFCSDTSFQTEAGIVEELSSLKTCLKCRKVDNFQLQVPFPPLNKLLPVQPRLQTTPTNRSESAVAVERTSNTVSKEGVHESCIEMSVNADEMEGDSMSFLESVVSTVSPVSVSTSIDWNTLAKQLIAVLEKAVHSRVVRAPHLPSSTLETHGATGSVDFEERGSEAAQSGSQEESWKKAMEFVRGKARVAVLFSGGVDSVLLAALVDK